MKNKYIFTNLLIVSVLSVLFFSCKNKENSKNKVQIQSYSNNYYFLQGDSIKSKNTLVVVIDPHADGKKAALLFEDIAKNFNCSVIGLTDVQNNQNDFLNRINNDINAAIKTHVLKVKEFYIAGFSGGARMAYVYAATYPTIVNGLLMCGAGLPANANPQFPVAMIIGTQDPNFGEQYISPYSQDEINDNKKLRLVFDGKHEWPSMTMINTAMSFLFSLNNKEIPQSVQDSLVIYEKKFSKSDDKYLYFRIVEANYKISKNDKKISHKQKIDSLLKDNKFYDFTKKLETSLNEETQRNETYYNLLPVKDTLWWKNEIEAINKKINSKDIFVKNSYARTKGFLGLVMYSLSSKELQNPQSRLIDKYLKIYEFLEPDNEDLMKFKQIRNSQKKSN